MTAINMVIYAIQTFAAIASLIVSLVIFRMQRKHEQEIDKLQKAQHKESVIERATRFLVDHDDERDYLPWSVIASALCRQKRHHRKIYTDFCCVPKEVQDEILAQVGITLEVEAPEKWVDISIEALKNDINKYCLGKDYLYEGAKYLHKCIGSYRTEPWQNATPKIFDHLHDNNPFGTPKTDIGTYIDEYIYYYVEKRKDFVSQPLPPIDYVDQKIHLSTCDEKEMCRWIMELVNSITVIVHNKTLSDRSDFFKENLTDAAAETFEDKYYETLLWLYYTYYQPTNNSQQPVKSERHRVRRLKSRKRVAEKRTKKE